MITGRIIQNALPSQGQPVSNLNSSLPCNLTCSQAPGNGTWTSVGGGHYSARHRGFSKIVSDILNGLTLTLPETERLERETQKSTWRCLPCPSVQ